MAPSTPTARSRRRPPAAVTRVLAVAIAACTMLSFVVTSSQAQTRARWVDGRTPAWLMGKSWGLGGGVSVNQRRPPVPGQPSSSPSGTPSSSPSSPTATASPSDSASAGDTPSPSAAPSSDTPSAGAGDPGSSSNTPSGTPTVPPSSSAAPSPTQSGSGSPSGPGSPTPTSPAPSPTPSGSGGGGTGPQYTNLQASYTFDQPLSNQWAIYDSSWGGDPYSRDPKLISVSNGMLHVMSNYKSGSGLCLCANGGDPTAPYGRWDIRARAGQNPDHGFAMLLWPVAEDWPSGGEIDIAEYPTASRNQVEFTLHYGANNSRILQNFVGDYSGWHTYSVEWAPTYIRYWIDGSLLATVTNPAAIPTRPMHLALQAGAWSSTPTNTSTSLDVDWIKVYH